MDVTGTSDAVEAVAVVVRVVLDVVTGAPCCCAVVTCEVVAIVGRLDAPPPPHAERAEARKSNTSILTLRCGILV